MLVVTDFGAEDSDDALAIAHALTDAGLLVLGVRAGDASLPDAVAHMKPDVIVVRSDSGVRDVLEHIAVTTQRTRRPIALFTDDEDRRNLRRACDIGISAYVVKGLRRERIASIVDVAIERFTADQTLREELDHARGELSDRKLIDAAKRLLMSKRGLSEPEAHRFLQDHAMRSGSKLRDAARQIVELQSLLDR